MSTPIPLGAKVKDKLSSFHGVAVGRAEYLFCATHVQVQSETLNAEGKAPMDWIEEARLQVIGTTP